MDLKGFEPLTAASVVQCSIQLSYKSVLSCKVNQNLFQSNALTCLKKKVTSLKGTSITSSIIYSFILIYSFIHMNTKALRLLLLLAAWPVTDAVSASSPTPINEAHFPVVDDTQETAYDTYESPVSNYASFTIEFLGMDYVLDLDRHTSAPLPLRKFDWGQVLRSNFALLYAIRVHQSRFAFCPGVGFSTLCYSFSAQKSGEGTIYKTLKRTGSKRTESQDIDTVAQLGRDAKVSSSCFKVPYIDFLLRMRFNSVLDEPKQGFHTWLGIKFSYRMFAKTIIEYSEYDDSGSVVERKGSFNLYPFAFGLQGAMGYNRFGLAGGYNFTPLFVKNQGPDNCNAIRPFYIGIYFDCF